jgi:hypothetical protein
MKAVAALGEIPGTIGAIIVDTAQTANGTKAGKDNHNGHNPDGLRQDLQESSNLFVDYIFTEIG